MMVRLKTFFPAFYEKFRFLLWFSIVCLTIPLFVRAADQFALNYNERYQILYDNHTVYANSLYATVASLIPVVT
jgi:hypothetical protein